MYILKVTTVEFVLKGKTYEAQIKNRYYKKKKKWKLKLLGWSIKVIGEKTNFNYVSYVISNN